MIKNEFHKISIRSETSKVPLSLEISYFSMNGNEFANISCGNRWHLSMVPAQDIQKFGKILVMLTDSIDERKLSLLKTDLDHANSKIESLKTEIKNLRDEKEMILSRIFHGPDPCWDFQSDD